MTKRKKVVYACITGEYDDIPVHKYVAPDWDYVLFTDNQELIRQGHFAHWTIRPLVFNKLTNVKNARWHKVNAHKLFPEYDYSLWLDSNIVVNNDGLFDLANKLIKQNTLVAVPNHPERKCIYAEAEKIKEYKIDYPDIVDTEINVLRDDGYPENNGLSETGILLRKHNEITRMLNLWWKMINTYSKRDQLSFNYTLWKTKTPYTPIYTDDRGFGMHRKSADFTFVFKASHDSNRIEKPNRHGIRNTIIRIIALFIPIPKYRRKFKDKFLRG